MEMGCSIQQNIFELWKRAKEHFGCLMEKAITAECIYRQFPRFFFDFIFIKKKNKMRRRRKDCEDINGHIWTTQSII